jgi:1-deoxy-D-xylulose-5-phosphate reductoisomerase
MELPIQYALSYPQRLPLQGKRLNLVEIGALTFSEPDLERFPCLKLCLQAGKAGGTVPAALNAANEVAVHLFLEGKIHFSQIAVIVNDAIDRHCRANAESVEAIRLADIKTREYVQTHFHTLEMS